MARLIVLILLVREKKFKILTITREMCGRIDIGLHTHAGRMSVFIALITL